jgi:sulfopropanediol 3-dehydrogenase
MPFRLDSQSPDFSERFRAFLGVKREAAQDVEQSVRHIIDEVRTYGDRALLQLTLEFDRLDLAKVGMRVTQAEIDAAEKSCNGDALAALKLARDRIEAYHLRQKPGDERFTDAIGVEMGAKWTAIEAVGLYVPGGTAAYPSSVLMNAVPAKVAGCPRLVIVVPAPDGKLSPLVLAAAKLAGVHEIYRIGGAQAIAALAYGTETIAPVAKIVGPGNAYVAEAKRQLFGRVGIDLLAGPTETLIIADDSVDGEICATDLLGQAEHGPTSPAVLITNSEKLARDTMSEVERLLKILPSADLAGQAWKDYGEVIVCDSIDEMVAEADRVASEHVQVMTRDPDYFLNNMKNYGSLFLGPRTNVAYGDKVIGTNHTLPTKKNARFTGGLWVGKFIKTCTYQKVLTDEASAKIGEVCSRLCMLEGFRAHAEQANVRVRRYGGRNVPYAQAAE